MALTLPDIEQLFADRGGEQYSGESVTQLEHALQCALLAEAEGADDELVTAALLHDLGHLLHDLGDTPSLQGVDDIHQYRALPFLRGLFGDAVRLRVWDDLAKAPGLATPPLSHFMERARRCASRVGETAS